jgi:Flp pilus assembly protein TadG
MKSKILFKERGQALVLVALAAVVLFGFVALAIDGSAKFSDRRHAQNAADTAALAGALALVNDETAACGAMEEWECAAFLRAEDNGYDNFTNNEVWVFKCNKAVADRDGAPLDCGSYEGDANYVAVVIFSRVNTTFAKVLGFNQTYNLVSAVTYWNKRGPLYDGHLIVALKPTPCTGGNGNIKFSGSATITLDGGGAFVNSTTGSCGITQGGTNCPIFTNDASLGSAGSGNINISPCTPPTGTAYNEDAYQFPPDMPDEPAICSTSQPSAPVNNSTLAPGYYSSFPPSSGAYNHMTNNITLQAGIYCLNTALSLSNNHSFTGTDVLIYIKSGVNNPISISGGTLKLTARSSGAYEGYVIIVASNFSGSSKSCTINGNSGAILTGTIFAPYCDITVNGNDSTASFDTQVIGYTVAINGTATTTLHYEADKNADSEPKIGLMQ